MRVCLLLSILLVGCAAPKKAAKGNVPFIFVSSGCIKAVDYTKAYCEAPVGASSLVCKNLKVEYVKECAVIEVRH